MSGKRMPALIFRDSKVPSLLSWFIPITGITIGPFIFIKKGHDTRKLINHEHIHITQQYELLFVFHWVLYGLFWLKGLVKYRNTYEAYRSVPFEKEAYDNEHNEFYHSTRKFWAWRDYV